MERNRCKLCFRNFSNGRALGGHMRSHMMNLYAPKNSSMNEEDEDQIPSDEISQENDEFHSVHDSYSSEEVDEEEEEENPEKSSSFVVQEGESEAELSKDNPICRRSKRVRKSRVFYSDSFPMNGFSQLKKSKYGEAIEQSPLSSISDTTPEEVAYCLMMLSRDNWERQSDYPEDSGFAKAKKTKVRGKYRCETCSKSFRSYQALGGHRASHKKVKVNDAAPPVEEEEEAAALVVEEKVHECPFCHRVFASGQALGGHKRSHFIGAAAISGNISTDKQFSRSLDIDLNLPAPDDDHDISH